MTSKLRIYFPGEVPPAAAAAPPPVVRAGEAKVPGLAAGVLALADVAHADAERFSDVECIEKWMLTFDDIDSMPIEDALDFLDVSISEDRGFETRG